MQKKMKSIMFSLAIIAAGVFSVFIYTDANAQGEVNPGCNESSTSQQCSFDPMSSCWAKMPPYGAYYAMCPQKRIF